MARPENTSQFSTTQLKYPDDIGNYNSAEQNFMIFNIYKANVVSGFSQNPEKSIALYIPTGALKTSYSSKYGSMEGYKQVIDAGAAAAKAINSQALDGGAEFSYGDALKSQMTSVAKNFAGAAQRQAANFAMQKSDVAKAAMAGAGVARNPFITVFFEGPGDFRKFTFSFDFIPRNSSEARTIREIITAFKKASLAEEITSGTPQSLSYFLGFPRQFDIEFFISEKVGETPGRRSKKVFRIGRSVCTDISVDYGGSGIPAFYKDGEPFHTKLDLSFQELSLLTSKDVDDTNRGGY